MDRRKFIGALAGIIALQPVHALAKTTRVFTPQGIRYFRSEVDFESFSQTAFDVQHMQFWCWAASISMVFSFYGHPVSQEKIVAKAYGAAFNWPAAAGIVMAQQLNRNWVDDQGEPFTSRVTAAYDSQARVRAINNSWIIRELDREHPIIVGAAGHAMVLTSMDYYQTHFGPVPMACGVFDPYPGRGPRVLQPAEFVPVEQGGALTFVVTVTVS